MNRFGVAMPLIVTVINLIFIGGSRISQRGNAKPRDDNLIIGINFAEKLKRSSRPIDPPVHADMYQPETRKRAASDPAAG